MKKKDGDKSFQGVSDSELSVLKQLWSGGPTTPNALQEKLSAEGTEWAYTTVQTLLHRLLKKGYVARERQGVAQVYEATVDRETLLGAHMAQLADRVCEGAATPLLLSLVRSTRFSKKDLTRMREILEEMGDAPASGGPVRQRSSKKKRKR